MMDFYITTGRHYRRDGNVSWRVGRLLIETEKREAATEKKSLEKYNSNMPRIKYIYIIKKIFKWKGRIF